MADAAKAKLASRARSKEAEGGGGKKKKKAKLPKSLDKKNAGLLSFDEDQF